MSLLLPPSGESKAAAQSLAATLVAWQRQHGRHSLPWQQTRDPYRVWLSEIMLQQTQVTTVLGYYERFLSHFPNVAALAGASSDEVLALWAGLGYYSRARNLHRCAQAVVSDWGGAFPPRAADLETLPGIGRSTAAAIAAFCFDERVAILDGNVKRVLSRALGFGADLAQAGAVRDLWQRAQDLLPDNPADMVAYTQGLMDLGSSLCRSRAPDCPACPLNHLCQARAQGRPEAFPVKTRTLKRSRKADALLLLHRADGLWLVQRPARGVWAGLWSLPEAPDVAAARAQLSAWPGQTWALPAFVHVLTHRDWTLSPVLHRLDDGLEDGPLLASLQAAWPSGRWVAWSDLPQHGLPAPVRKLLAHMPPVAG